MKSSKNFILERVLAKMFDQASWRVNNQLRSNCARSRPFCYSIPIRRRWCWCCKITISQTSSILLYFGQFWDLQAKNVGKPPGSENFDRGWNSTEHVRENYQPNGQKGRQHEGRWVRKSLRFQWVFVFSRKTQTFSGGGQWKQRMSQRSDWAVSRGSNPMLASGWASTRNMNIEKRFLGVSFLTQIPTQKSSICVKKFSVKKLILLFFNTKFF